MTFAEHIAEIPNRVNLGYGALDSSLPDWETRLPDTDKLENQLQMSSCTKCVLGFVGVGEWSKGLDIVSRAVPGIYDYDLELDHGFERLVGRSIPNEECEEYATKLRDEWIRRIQLKRENTK